MKLKQRNTRFLPYLLAGLGLLISTLGCSRKADHVRADQEQGDPPKTPTAQAILKEMIGVYTRSATYSDQGVFQLRYRSNGQAQVDEVPFAVAMKRPNRLEIRAYQATIVSDGEYLYAHLADDATNHLDGQLLARRASAKWTLAELFDDTVLRSSVVDGLGRHPLPLEMLLSDSPLDTILSVETERKLLDPSEIEGVLCDRVEAQSGEGRFVFWIDADSRLLRRLQYPSELFLDRVGNDTVSDIEIVADFRNARVGEAIADRRFAFDTPASAKLVSQLKVPPQPLATNLFGKRPASFYFTTTRGSRISRESLEGQISVLLWFNIHPVCEAAVRQLQQVYRQLETDRRFQFLAVCVEPSNAGTDRLERTLRNWDAATVPWARDLKAFGRDAFQVPWAPTLVVLDARGMVQLFQVGHNPDLAVDLPQILQRLASGENLASEVLSQYQESLESYQAHLRGELSLEQLTSIRRPQSEIRPLQMPARLKLERRWANETIKGPGNVVRVETKDGGYWLVLAQGGWIFQVDDGGQVIAKKQLPSEGQHATYLRPVTDVNGDRWFACAGIGGGVTQIFDAEWRLVARYPTADLSGEISDVQWVDADSDGHPELLVGFPQGELRGVHCIGRDGHRRWVSQDEPSPLSLVVDRSERPDRILVAGPSGQVTKIVLDGTTSDPVSTATRQLFHIYAAQGIRGVGAAFCGISYSPEGHLVAVGLDRQLKDLWKKRLVGDSFRTPIQFVTSTVIERHIHWIVAAPDGTVHFLPGDGQPPDEFATGQTLTGVAAALVGPEMQLVIGSESSISAWAVTEP